ncbi:MAG: hypothetical protein JO235_16570 [Chroococcidiopsidaceae cyanobacterium CP_BM_RX_35]|nr:hypothetical protein [Chroococcidiopsidaceae cyanobacterium CP_BM_RX_35]
MEVRAESDHHDVKLCKSSQAIRDSMITMDWAGFILKVLIVSTGLAAAIRYIGPTVSIPTTQLNILVIVCMPTVIVAIVLLWRISKIRQQN